MKNKKREKFITDITFYNNNLLLLKTGIALIDNLEDYDELNCKRLYELIDLTFKKSDQILFNVRLNNLNFNDILVELVELICSSSELIVELILKKAPLNVIDLLYFSLNEAISKKDVVYCNISPLINCSREIRTYINNKDWNKTESGLNNDDILIPYRLKHSKKFIFLFDSNINKWSNPNCFFEALFSSLILFSIEERKLNKEDKENLCKINTLRDKFFSIILK